METVKNMERQGFETDFISPGVSGRIKEEDIIDKVTERTLIVSVMHVNNETGIIQPVKELGEELQNRNILFHVDATQSCGKLVDELKALKYDMLSFSAHKLMGPQGVGALILKKKSYKLPPVKPIMFGGQQEHGIRPGTIPVALVAGCGIACELAGTEYRQNNELAKQIKEGLLIMLEESGLNYHINGDQTYCIPSTLNICIDGVSSEALMISTKHLCSISNGSACTSKSYDPSYVLTAMGIPKEQIESSIRISWGHGEEKEEVIEGFRALLEMAAQIQ